MNDRIQNTGQNLMKLAKNTWWHMFMASLLATEVIANTAKKTRKFT